MIDFRPRIVIIEPVTEIRQGYSLILSSNNKYNVVNTYAHPTDAISSIRRDYPDIIIMDLILDGINGIESILKLKRIDRKVQILINSAIEESTIIFDALSAGASGFIIKGSNHNELFNAVDEILNNGAPMSPKVARIVVSSFKLNPHSPLSNRETEILQLLALGKTYKIAANELSIGIETVKSHVKNIYSKLQASTKSEAIDIARKNSLI
jgi:DNA-binding NarL/FixJ family response regulator